MKNVKTKRENNFFDVIVSEEVNELSGTNSVAETNSDSSVSGHLGVEEFLYTQPKRKNPKAESKDVDNDLIDNFIYMP